MIDTSTIVTRASILRFAFLCAAHAVIVIAFITAAPRFDSLFRAFGAEVPLPTRIILDHFHLACAFLILSAFVQLALFVILLRARTPAARARLPLIGMLNGVVAVLFMLALYVPIFTLGSVV